MSSNELTAKRCSGFEVDRGLELSRIFPRAISLAAIMLTGMMMLSPDLLAAKGVCKDGTPPPCKPSSGEEPSDTSNNLSFPLIFSDNIPPEAYATGLDTWGFASGLEVSDCVQQEEPVQSVPPDVLCYYGMRNLGIDEETGEWEFADPLAIWYLQQRSENSWRVYNGDAGTTSVVVTAVDVGDLLESSITIKAKQIRTEFTMFLNADGTEFDEWISTENGGPCPLDEQPDNCFAAMPMSGAVPGTDQSINEIQGTNYPEDGYSVINPRDVKEATNYVASSGAIAPYTNPFGFDATLYSHCVKLVIQPVAFPDAADIYWDSYATEGVNGIDHPGYWQGPGVEPPVVNIATWDDTFSVETNAGGTLIYGYNWNTKVLAEKGNYRLTWVLDRDSCPTTLNTVFGQPNDESGYMRDTVVINAGERRPAVLVPMGHITGATRNEGGLVYIDVVLSASGGGNHVSTPSGGAGH